jgi:hypothetical protein
LLLNKTPSASFRQTPVASDRDYPYAMRLVSSSGMLETTPQAIVNSDRSAL